MSIRSIDEKSDEYVPQLEKSCTFEDFLCQCNHFKRLNVNSVRYPLEQAVHDMEVNNKNISIDRILLL